MSEMKDMWKSTGTTLGHAFKDLGKSIVKSARVGLDKADEWINSEEQKKEETINVEVKTEEENE